MMTSRFRRFLLIALGLALLVLASPASAALRWNTQVSSPAEQTGNLLTVANTTRKVAVHPNGTIYVCYHGSNGIHVARSQDGGQTFPTDVQVFANDYQAEVAVSSTGIVYVAWVASGIAYVSRSVDQGATFGAAVAAGATPGTAVHMATDGSYVYLINPSCGAFLRSTDGAQTFSPPVSLLGGQNYADVHVDPANHNVIVQADNPTVKYFVSTDYGATFGGGSPVMLTPSPSVDVYYSVGALSSGAGGRYLFVAGYNFNSDGTDQFARVDVADGSSTTPSIPDSDSTSGRSLAADIFGNVVTGYTNAGSVEFSVSTDLGASFGSTVVVDTAAQSCAAINSTNGDVMFGYEKGGKIYLSVYNGLLLGYGLTVDSSNLTFATQTVATSSSPKTVTITNPSGSAIAINGITASGDFSQTNTASGSLGAGASFTVNVTFTPTQTGTRTGQVDIDYGSAQHRIITLSGDGTAAAGSGAPTTQATNITFPGATASQITVNWTSGNGAARAVFMKAASSGQATPADFTTYTASATFGSGDTAGTGWYCVYNGAGNAVTVSGLTASTTYRVQVVEYNGGAGAQAYNATTNGTNPANKATTAPVAIPAMDLVGTTIMALLLMAGGAYTLRNRRMPTLAG